MKKPAAKLSPSSRLARPKMVFKTFASRDPLLTRQALDAFTGGGIWSTGTTVNLATLEKSTGRRFADLLYTPGVSASSLKLSDLHLQAQKKNTPQAWETFWLAVDRFTPKFRRVAVISDATRVLGLGDIGPFAGQQVMYGKSLLFGLFGGLYAEPHVLTSTAAPDIVDYVLNGQAVWGGVNLEDIESPKCFSVLAKLRQQAEIAVWHDDQQGTAAVILAGLLNALRVVGKKLNRVKIVFVGLGAANTKTFEYLVAAGADPTRCLALDSGGVIHPKRSDIDWSYYPNKLEVAKMTQPAITGGPTEAFKNTDAVIGLSSPGSFNLRHTATMTDKAVVFACANPLPEIDPHQAALLPNVAVVGTGRSDFPNQVNNSLFFPGCLAGALAVGSRDISDAMVIAGAQALAATVPHPRPTAILPTMTLANMTRISPLIGRAVAAAAMQTGLARFKKPAKKIEDAIRQNITHFQKTHRSLARNRLLR